MKKNLLLFTALFGIIFISCKKDEDTSSSSTASSNTSAATSTTSSSTSTNELVGKWGQFFRTNLVDTEFVKKPDTTYQTIEFTDSIFILQLPNATPPYSANRPYKIIEDRINLTNSDNTIQVVNYSLFKDTLSFIGSKINTIEKFVRL